MKQFMPYSQPNQVVWEKITKAAFLSSATLLLFAMGCGSNTDTGAATATTPTNGPQNYFSPYVAGSTGGSAGALLPGPELYSLDDFANKFAQSTFRLLPPQQQGPQVINAGVTTPGKRNLLQLGITANYTVSSLGTYVATPFSPPKQGSFAVELAQQAGGLVQIVGQPAVPLVAATNCPTSKAAQTYQFLTIPAGLIDSSKGEQAASWDPKVDTAYGAVDISSSGNSVTFNNIHQYTLPSVGGSGTPAQPSPSSVVGACGSTVFGNTITVGQLVVQTPGGVGGQSVPPQASVGIGPTGMLVEHNGAGDTNSTFPGTSPSLPYDNTLGAGTGAVGLPRPSSAMDITAVRNAQYLGFVYGAGVAGNPSAPPAGWSSRLASFGFANTPASCASITASTGTVIYGGDFMNNDPSTSSDGFGNCDLAVDLGTQDTANNGLFPKATVWLGGNYGANSSGKTYSFPAVAIAGQLGGKYAVFVLGVDSTQPWAIYLLQSN